MYPDPEDVRNLEKCFPHKQNNWSVESLDCFRSKGAQDPNFARVSFFLPNKHDG